MMLVFGLATVSMSLLATPTDFPVPWRRRQSGLGVENKFEEPERSDGEDDVKND